MIPNPLQAVIFDMDGLLLDTETISRTAIFTACANQGQVMTSPLHLSLIGTPRETGDALLSAHFDDRFDLAAFHRDCDHLFEEACRTSLRLRPGARDLMDDLRARRIPIGVATSTARPRAETHLRAMGLLDLIDVLVTRTDVTHGKPHPESFLKAAAALGAVPTFCLALEDSHNGVRAAASAGMATIMVPDLLEPTDEIRRLCVGIVPSLVDLRPHLAS